MTQQSHLNPDRALEALKQGYALIRKGRIKTWQVWLIVGIFAGALGTTIFIANRSGEVEKGQASDIANIVLPLNVELELPYHLPDSLRRPQRIFSGRKLLIKNATPFNVGSASLSRGGAVVPLNAKKAKRIDDALSVEIPDNVSSGVYEISYTLDNVVKSFPLMIHGLTPQEKQPARVLQRSIDPETQLAQGGMVLSPTPTIVYRTKICDNCSWELSFMGDPQDPQKLVHISTSDVFMRSTTAGRSWILDFINTVTVYPRPNIAYRGDPKIVTARNYGGFYLSALFSDFTDPARQKTGGILYKGGYSGGPGSANLNASIFQDIPA